LADTLKAHPSVGLIFIRKQNDKISKSSSLPETIKIAVLDRFDNEGEITVQKTKKGTLAYYYGKLTPKDPLAYLNNDEQLPQGGDYTKWNSFSVEKKHYYHNAVAGIGSILYSNNPSTGDVLIMHSQDWNFGDNSGGHGGLHRGEKLTFMMASGPGISKEGPLVSKTKTGRFTYPTLLDIVPSVLNWLDYSEEDFEKFKNNQFEDYLQDWNSKQKKDILANFRQMDDLTKSLKLIGFEDLEIERFIKDFERILEFLPERVPEINNLKDKKLQGNKLVF